MVDETQKITYWHGAEWERQLMQIVLLPDNERIKYLEQFIK